MTGGPPRKSHGMCSLYLRLTVVGSSLEVESVVVLLSRLDEVELSLEVSSEDEDDVSELVSDSDEDSDEVV